MRKVPKALVLGILLITAAVFADWQAELWKGGIWSDGSNLTVTGTVTAPSGFVGPIEATSLQVGDLQIVGYGTSTVLPAASGTTPTVTVANALPGDYSHVTVTSDNITSNTSVYKATVTTNTVNILLSADPVTTSSYFATVYRVVE